MAAFGLSLVTAVCSDCCLCVTVIAAFCEHGKNVTHNECCMCVTVNLCCGALLSVDVAVAVSCYHPC